MATNIHGKHYRPWNREGRNRYGGTLPRVTFRAFWGYHREMSLEKSYHEPNNLHYGYRGGRPDDFYRFGGVGAREYKAQETITKRWTDLLAQCKGVLYEDTFNAVELAQSRHGAMLHQRL